MPRRPDDVDDATGDNDQDDPIERILQAGPPTILYQPVVDLSFASHPVVGYEALARWPGITSVSTEEVFARARRSRRVAELDMLCSSAAIRGALDAGIDLDTGVFVNIEPAAMTASMTESTARTWRAAVGRLNVVLELTERRLLENASRLLTGIGLAREQGWYIAVDDVGVNPQSLAMLEFIRPDMVKLDMGFVQRPMDAELARTLRGVSAYVERTGSALLAEGVETEEQLERAVEVGATHAQGFLFGRPGVLRLATAPFRPRHVEQLAHGQTPFQLMSSRRGYRIARRGVLENLGADIERQAMSMNDPPVVLVALRREPASMAEAVSRWGEFAKRTSMMVLFADGMTTAPMPGVRGVDVGGDDSMLGEAAIVVLGTNGAIALAAQDLGDDGDDDERRYRYSMTQDRDLVAAAGLSLLNRLDSVVDAPA